MENEKGNPGKRNKDLQGVSHLLIITLVPLLLVCIVFTESMPIRVLFSVLLLFLFGFIWKKIVKRNSSK
jgi:uncharacterized membrane protein